MRLHLCRTVAAGAMIVLSGAAFADVTVSQSNDPSTLFGEQFGSLFDAEHAAVNSLADSQLSDLANGAVRGQAQPGNDPAQIEYSEAWLASLPEPTGDEQWECMRRALYFEARGESLKGQFAVAEVILNRVESPDFPGSVCAVINSRGSGACAFSFVCSGSKTMSDAASRDRAGRIARVMLDGAPRTLTMGATYFHANYVSPNWGRRVQTAAIGAHIFYR
jgi:spore germination cell wall hydrolase CwlJ-like protein